MAVNLKAEAKRDSCMLQVASFRQSSALKFLLASSCSPRISGALLFVLAALVFCADGRADFWPLKDKKPETVTLTRRLSPVASRSGTTVQFTVQASGASVPPEAASVLQQRVQTLLLDAKLGDIRIVEQGPADTVIKCTVTGYEPKSTHPNQRQVGLQQESLMTWIGNVEASVQVTDMRDRPIVAANLKYHLENDFVTSEKEQQVAQVNDKKKSWKEKMLGTITAAKGGKLSDLAALVGQQEAVEALTRSQEKGSRPPTDPEWRDALLEGMAVKIASLIVPVNQDFEAIMPTDSAFDQIRTLAKDKRWGDVQEQAEKMAPLQGPNEAYRLYLIGLSHEALGCQNPEHPKDAAEELNKASLYYSDALKVRDDHELRLANMRVRDSIDHYLQIEHYDSSKSSPHPAVHDDTTSTDTKKSDVADNNALIEMFNSNLPPSILLTYVQTVASPKFDISSRGLMALSNAKIPADIISAVQKRMSTTGRPHTSQAVKRASAAPQPR
jgi:hypothetical protein